ncbi:hypothetical protein [Winogradskyella sp. PC D3.3]
MRYIFILIILCCFSCNNERVLHLPEIENAEVTEVLDVSPAYLFYDETQPDSTLLNRKNLIITTNWLVNVDKRLTLKQAIPHIKFLQDKKRNAEMHKNEDAKNYFTCNDTRIENLGFLEFTDVYYEFTEADDKPINIKQLIQKEITNDSIISDYLLKLPIQINNDNKTKIKDEIIEILKQITTISEDKRITEFSINLYFDENLSFQDYISIKSEILEIDTKKVIIDSNEFIY